MEITWRAIISKPLHGLLFLICGFTDGMEIETRNGLSLRRLERRWWLYRCLPLRSRGRFNVQDDRFRRFIHGRRCDWGRAGNWLLTVKNALQGRYLVCFNPTQITLTDSILRPNYTFADPLNQRLNICLKHSIRTFYFPKFLCGTHLLSPQASFKN
jgi:hypothetical protein